VCSNASPREIAFGYAANYKTRFSPLFRAVAGIVSDRLHTRTYAHRNDTHTHGTHAIKRHFEPKKKNKKILNPPKSERACTEYYTQRTTIILFVYIRTRYETAVLVVCERNYRTAQFFFPTIPSARPSSGIRTEMYDGSGARTDNSQATVSPKIVRARARETTRFPNRNTGPYLRGHWCLVKTNTCTDIDVSDFDLLLCFQFFNFRNYRRRKGS